MHRKVFRKNSAERLSWRPETLGLVEGGIYMTAIWRREDIPYDVMGDYSAFHFADDEREEAECEDQDSEVEEKI